MATNGPSFPLASQTECGTLGCSGSTFFEDFAESSPLLPPIGGSFPGVAKRKGTSTPWSPALAFSQNFCNAGVLFLPYYALQLGTGWLVGIVLVVCILNHYMVTLLLWCVELSALGQSVIAGEGLSYQSLVLHISGPKWHATFLVIQALDLFGVVIAHLSLVAEALLPLLSLVPVPLQLITAAGHGWVCLCISLGLLPLIILFEARTSTWTTTLLPVAGVLLIVLMVGCVCTRLLSAVPFTSPLQSTEVSCAGALPLVLFCFLPHFSLFGIYTEVTGRDSRLLMKAVQLSLLATLVIYTIWAALACFAWVQPYTGLLPPNLLLALDPRAPVALAVRLVVTGAILLTIPAFCTKLATVMSSLCFLNPSYKATTSVAVTGILGTAALVAAQIPHSLLVFKILGASTSILLGHVLPVVLYLHVHRHTVCMVYLEHSSSWLPSAILAKLILLFVLVSSPFLIISVAIGG